MPLLKPLLMQNLIRPQIFLRQIRKRNFYGTQNRVSANSLLTILKKFNAKNVLIVTNRPAIANSWFDDFDKFIDGYYFISTADSLKERETCLGTSFLIRLIHQVKISR